jgi:hypothetical protein
MSSGDAFAPYADVIAAIYACNMQRREPCPVAFAEARGDLAAALTALPSDAPPVWQRLREDAQTWLEALSNWRFDVCDADRLVAAIDAVLARPAATELVQKIYPWMQRKDLA